MKGVGVVHLKPSTYLKGAALDKGGSTGIKGSTRQSKKHLTINYHSQNMQSNSINFPNDTHHACEVYAQATANYMRGWGLRPDVRDCPSGWTYYCTNINPAAVGTEDLDCLPLEVMTSHHQRARINNPSMDGVHMTSHTLLDILHTIKRVKTPAAEREHNYR